MSGAGQDIKSYWAEAREAAELPAEPDDVYAFGDSPELADELLALILSGDKQATADLAETLAVEGHAEPWPGKFSLILDGGGRPATIIRTTRVTRAGFDEVDEGFARKEGEGDKSLDYWRREHRGYYTRWLSARGRSFSGDMMLVLEEFERVYP